MSKGIFDWIMNRVDLPSEPSPSATLVELVGDRRILIENHYGVTSYNRTRIQIKTTYGYLCVCGSGLELACMSKQQIVITGCIEQASLVWGKT